VNLFEAGYKPLHFLTDGFAFVVMDIMAAFEINGLGICLTGEVPGIFNPVFGYLFTI